MSSDTRIDKLKNEGDMLFVYNDKQNVFFIFHDTSENKLYKIETDKYLDIEEAEELVVPKGFLDYSKIKFFKPYNDGFQNIFIGVVKIGEVYSKFNINNGEVELTEQITYTETGFTTVKALADIEVDFHIQKKNKLFIVGHDVSDDGYEPVYGVVDIENNRFESIYYIYSDKGEINLTSLSIDTDLCKVYVVGSLAVEANNNQTTTYPFVESFLLK